VSLDILGKIFINKLHIRDKAKILSVKVDTHEAKKENVQAKVWLSLFITLRTLSIVLPA